MWNDTDVPLALLITFRCYGTWLHGDERGSVTKGNNIYGTPYIPENKSWLARNIASLNHPPVNLDAEMRRSVELAIKETCNFRNWALFAANVRTNHVHSVIRSGDISSKKVLQALKSNATRKLREDSVWLHEHSPWSAGGSRRKLWNESSIDAAIDYVLYGQGNELPDFD